MYIYLLRLYFVFMSWYNPRGAVGPVIRQHSEQSRNNRLFSRHSKVKH